MQEIGRFEMDQHADEIIKYRNCMLEIRDRMFYIRERLAIGSSEEKKVFDTEIICYQFRAIIELILLSSLVAHKKYYTDKLRSISGIYKVEVIVEKLLCKNKNFYPIAVKAPARDKNDQEVIFSMVYKESPYLSLIDAQKVFKDCSEYLHTKNPFSKQKDYTVWQNFAGWLKSIEHLLTWHVINMFNAEKGFLVNINFANVERKDQVNIIYLKSQPAVSSQAPEHL